MTAVGRARRRLSLAAAVLFSAAGLALSLLPRGPQPVDRDLTAATPMPAADPDEAGAGPGEPPPVTALRRGNRRLRAGDPEAALAIWAAGWQAARAAGDREVQPALAYNLGTTAHRLGRRAEAILWYRRAAAAGAADRWLTDNLELARAEVGAPRRPPPGLAGRAAAHRAVLKASAVTLAWSAAVLLLVQALRRPTPAEDDGDSGVAAAVLRWLAPLAALAALAVWAGAWALASWGPRPAVLTDSCTAGDHRLPAGSEVWVRSAEGGGWALAGGAGGATCPAAAVGLVE